jgi:hypothetical protein
LLIFLTVSLDEKTIEKPDQSKTSEKEGN